MPSSAKKKEVSDTLSYIHVILYYDKYVIILRDSYLHDVGSLLVRSPLGFILLFFKLSANCLWFNSSFHLYIIIIIFYFLKK